MISGLYISIKAESRGGWSTIPAMITCWLIIQIKAGSASQLNKKNLIVSLITFQLLIIGAATLIYTNDAIHNRLSHTIYEITTWFQDPTIYTSAGSRLSMWVVSAELIYENWIGYGEVFIKDIATKHPLNIGIHQHGVRDLIQAGPHSDILSKGLSLGILGIFSYLLIIFLPIYIFFSKITCSNYSIQKAAQMGCIYITGVFIAGLFNETLSLKYLCSFYGLMIACLAADVLRDNSFSPIQNPIRA
jgi:O-antigen ligase